MMDESFANALQRALSKSELTQKELAQKAGITEAAVSHYIKGDRTPRANVVVKLAEVLKCSLSDLLYVNNSDNFDGIYKIIARSVKQLNNDEKAKLVKILFSDI